MNSFISNITSVSENDVNPEAVLELRVDDLNWQGKQVTSLCDRFQIHMFTEEFEEAQERVLQMEKKEENRLFCNVMYQEEVQNQEIEEIFDRVMAKNTETIIKTDYSKEDASHFDFGAFIYLFAGIVVTGTILWLLRQRRKKK